MAYLLLIKIGNIELNQKEVKMSTRRKTIQFFISSSVLLYVFSLASLGGQQQTGTEDKTNELDAATKAKIIEKVAETVSEKYVFPDIGKKVADYIRKRLKEKAYGSITSLDVLSKELTKDIQVISHDLHMGVTARGKGPMTKAPPEVQWSERYLKWQRFQNWGFKKVDRLLGNVGFIALDEFVFPEMDGKNVAKETAKAAMTMIKDCYALIFDLRDNFGGREEMALLLLSYLFEKPEHILTQYNREKGDKEIWTSADEEGDKVVDIPIYILTSSHTVSGGEMFAFVLKNRKRAKIIGEKTRGAAHKTHLTFVPELGINIAIPNSAIVDPVTGTDWEGKGVEPDIATPVEKAKDTAYKMALDHILDTKPDRMERSEVEWAMMEVETNLNPVTLDAAAIGDYVGIFGKRKIAVAESSLTYQREGGSIYKLKPMSKDLFAFESEAMFYVRIRFGRDDYGNINKIILLY
ncbi:MAG: S41 family peptidase, partial [Cyclobacteriaceae bacterium]|nr:S41 family peptidase [Cyclobacteriaceae bacterium]